MTEPNEQFEELFGKFEGEEDKAIVESNREVYELAQKLKTLSHTEGGKVLVQTLRDNITKATLALFETRQSKYVSIMEANFDLLTKIRGAESQSNEILEWLDSLN